MIKDLKGRKITMQDNVYFAQLYPNVESLPVGIDPLLNDMYLKIPLEKTLSFLMYLYQCSSQLMAAHLEGSVFGSPGSR